MQMSIRNLRIPKQHSVPIKNRCSGIVICRNNGMTDRRNTGNIHTYLYILTRHWTGFCSKKYAESNDGRYSLLNTHYYIRTSSSYIIIINDIIFKNEYLRCVLT